MYTKKSGKLLKIMSLPSMAPTEQNLFLHILRTHLQTILAKSADQQAPPELDITKYGWEIEDGIPVPATSDQPPGPQDLMDVVRCGCKAAEKACGTERCSCRHGKISCTVCTALVLVATPASTGSRQETKIKMKWKRKVKQMCKMTRKLNILTAHSALMMNGNDRP